MVFDLAASGLTDREVAERTGRRPKHIAELLTNRIYIGELRGGGRREPVIEREVWERVQANRARHARRVPGPTRHRDYLLSGLLHCRACGHSLTGHVGRYRHVDGCETFRSARTEAFWDRRGKGDSYRTEVYDPIVPRALEHITAQAELVAAVTDAVVNLPTPVNEMALQRIKRRRQEALERMLRDRDYVVLKATMDELDAEEAEVHATVETPVTPSDVAEALSDMRRLFGKAQPRTQQRVAQALFKRVEVLGPLQVWVQPSEEAEAQGWASAMRGDFKREVRSYGRGERARADTPSPSLIIPVTNVPSYVHRDWKTA